mgnify:CR=1 FL=1
MVETLKNLFYAVNEKGKRFDFGVLDTGKSNVTVFNPTEYVDVTPYIDKKVEMLECHESQIVWMRDHDHIDFPDMVRTCCRYRGFQCGADYAEGFKQCQVYLKGTTKRYLP